MFLILLLFAKVAVYGYFLVLCNSDRIHEFCYKKNVASIKYMDLSEILSECYFCYLVFKDVQTIEQKISPEQQENWLSHEIYLSDLSLR